MNHRYILIVALICAFFTSTCLAQDIPKLFPKEGLADFKKKAPIVVNGDEVTYRNEQKTIVGTGNVSITYGDIVLTCDKITVHTDTKIGICEGNVKITQPGATFIGERIEYNFVEKTGTILKGHVNSEPFYGYADKIEKVSDNKVVFEEGYVTTCDHKKPHYKIRARRIQFYIDDKVIAKHVFFYIGNIPVLYVPYYVQPLRDTKTKINIIPGYSDEWGYYALGSYRYYFNEQCKGYLRLDYRAKKGLGEGIDYSYDIGTLGEGVARYYFTQENNTLAMAPTGKVDDRYRFQYKHSIDFTEDTKGTMEINKLSDEDIIKDYFFTELEDGWTPENYISLISQKQNYSFEVLTEKRLDEFFTVTEKLPELNLEVYSQRLWDSNFYYYNDMTLTNFKKLYAESEDNDDEESVRMDSYNKLSYVTKILNFLHTTPYIGMRQTYYSKNRWKDENLLREIYEYGVDFSTKFYRVFDTEREFLDIHKLRHVIAPTVGFRHRHQPTISPDNLFQFDTVDALDYENLIDLSLENKLQTKRKDGDKWQDVDLLRCIVGTEYHYRFKKGNLGFQGVGRFSDINFELELKPYDGIFAKTDITMYIEDYSLNNAIKTAHTDIVCNLGEKVDFGIGHIYEHSVDESSSQFTTELDYKINEDWAVRVYERFDAHENEWKEQEYTIYKTLHCWLAEFTCNIKDDDFAVWVVFRIKAFPDIPIGFNRAYRRPSPGAATTN